VWLVVSGSSDFLSLAAWAPEDTASLVTDRTSVPWFLGPVSLPYPVFSYILDVKLRPEEGEICIVVMIRYRRFTVLLP